LISFEQNQFTLPLSLLVIYDSYIRVLLEESPSLKPELEQKLSDAYRRAKIEAGRQIGISEDRFPEICPFTLEEILDNEF
jgi:hypothetical protein